MFRPWWILLEIRIWGDVARVRLGRKAAVRDGRKGRDGLGSARLYLYWAGKPIAYAASALAKLARKAGYRLAKPKRVKTPWEKASKSRSIRVKG